MTQWMRYASVIIHKMETKKVGEIARAGHARRHAATPTAQELAMAVIG